MRVGINSVYVFYEGGTVAVDLVAWSGAEFEDPALSGAEQRGDNGVVF